MSFVAKLKSMPGTLAGLSCLFLFCGSLAIMGAVFPNRISREELWNSWDGLLILSIGLAMIFFSLAVFKRIRMIRYLWPMLFAVMLAHALIARPDQMTEQLLESIFWLLISSWYFFRKQTVVRYFDLPKLHNTEQATPSTSSLKVEP